MNTKRGKRAPDETVREILSWVEDRHPGEREYLQAVCDMAVNIVPFLLEHRGYREQRIFERLTEPDRLLTFRVVWQDDKGETRINRGYRVQHSNAIGPYKGGLRFHPTVNTSILKFLAFEQTFKNSLTGLPMGGAKGGADFDPKERSDHEIMRFCQSFMTELHRHIGLNTDIPAGDIGVGAREISYLFGQYKRIHNEFAGVLTGKGLAFAGSEIRVEATGYGCVYIMQDMLEHRGETIEGKTSVISGAGNVALYTAEKLIELGAKPVTLSDSSGFIHDPNGIDADKLSWVKELKNERRGRISEYADEFGVEYHEGSRPWSVPCDLAFPCATQNELGEKDANELVNNGCMGVAEGANMPSERAAIEVFQDAGLGFLPSKAANAGGVAVSGLEITQNNLRLSWSRDELNERLRDIMSDIHDRCVEHGAGGEDHVDYLKGANIAGFKKVADAVLKCGVL